MKFPQPFAHANLTLSFTSAQGWHYLDYIAYRKLLFAAQLESL
jgi:hypothetical protein